ncbi:hypothetical protein E2C01_085335 [Portunus trituberculatus]|uniref:Uncharacterized protein n=1 Tax=Portunus trituberculatus TaxID=210409 RepID=A0A5B7JDB6_PORTR|nr:hypothetical protein [Portunus trituberculatus]
MNEHPSAPRRRRRRRRMGHQYLSIIGWAGGIVGVGGVLISMREECEPRRRVHGPRTFTR